MEQVLNQPVAEVRRPKWVNVVDVEYVLNGITRHAYFHPQSERLESFKKDRSMNRKIISVTDTRILKGVHWIN